MSVGRRLKRLRVRRGLTQKELAEPDYTHAYVSTIEAGRRRPSRSALEHFAKKLGVDVEELATGRSPGQVARLESRLEEARRAVSAGRFDEAEGIVAQVRREARTANLVRVAARAQELSALSAERQGRFDEAIDLYDAALETLANEPATTRAYATAGKARSLHSLGDISYAIYLLESSVELLRRQNLRDPTALVQLQAPLVLAYVDAGMRKRAAETAGDVLRLASHVKDPATLAAMHVNVARAYLQKGDYADADESYKRAEQLYRELDLRTELGVAHLARGYAFSRRGDLEPAREQLIAAKAIFEKTHSPVNQANSYCELARVERLQGNPDAARPLLDEAMNLLRGAEELGMLAWTHREIALCGGEQGDPTTEKHFRQAIELYERSEEVEELAVTYRYLGDFLQQRGSHQEACDAYRQGVVAIEKLV